MPYPQRRCIVEIEFRGGKGTGGSVPFCSWADALVPVLVAICCVPGHLQGGCGCRREAVLRQEREGAGAALEGRERTGGCRELAVCSGGAHECRRRSARGIDRSGCRGRHQATRGSRRGRAAQGAHGLQGRSAMLPFVRRRCSSSVSGGWRPFCSWVATCRGLAAVPE
jgi:hypothetical protein